MSNRMCFLGAFLGLALIASHSAGAQDYSSCKPIKDFIDQNRCFMRVAIQSADYARLNDLISSPYVDVNDRSMSGETYLTLAVRLVLTQHSNQAGRTLLAAGANPNLNGTTTGSAYPLSSALALAGGVKTSDDAALVDDTLVLLLKSNANPNVRVLTSSVMPGEAPFETTPLWAAAHMACTDSNANLFASHAKLKSIDELLKGGADANAVSSNNKASILMSLALFWSEGGIYVECPNVIQKLIAGGARVDGVDKDGLSVSDYASLYPIWEYYPPSHLVECTTESSQSSVPHNQRAEGDYWTPHRAVFRILTAAHAPARMLPGGKHSCTASWP